MKSESGLPFGSEFSPSQINLSELLELCKNHQNEPVQLRDSILNKFFSKHGNGSESNKLTLAGNCCLGLKCYGILDDEYNFTDIGNELYSSKDDENILYSKLAKHILLNLNGMTFIQCLRDMEAGGVRIKLETIPQFLEDRGIAYPKGGKHPSIMRLWLEKAGIFKERKWIINENRISEILGTNDEDFEALEGLSREQRAFLLTLANIDSDKPLMANEVVKLASLTYGIRFPEKSLPKAVLNELVQCGFITIEKTTGGRGAKPFIIHCTDKLQKEIIVPLLEQLKNQIDSKLYSLIRKPFNEILEEMDSEDTYISGLALEAFAFKMMKILDIKYLATRLRGQSTGGAEIDLIFESARLIYSRWQIQCKNTSRVSLDDVAKEVGLTHFLKSNVIVMVSTGDIGSEARRYANKIMTDSNLCIVMIDRSDIENIKNSVSYIADIFNREALHAMNIKALEL